MKQWKKIIISAILLGNAMICGAEENKVEGNFGKGDLNGQVEIINKMVWRGILATDNPTILPTLTYKLPHWRFGIYGIYDFQQKYKEVDFEVAYILGDFELCATDFYMPHIWDQIYRIFDVKKNTNCHVFDIFLKYSPHYFPVWALVSTMPLGGADRIDGKQYFSTYCELGIYHTFPLNIFASLQAGAGVNKGMYTAYQDGGFNVVNICANVSRDFVLGDIAFPAKLIYTYNPYMKSSIFGFSFGIRL